MSRSLAHYPFPDDDNQTLTRLISTLSEEDRDAMTWRPTRDWLLEVSPGFARGLSDMFAEAGVHQPDTDWRPGGVLVPDAIRSSVAGVLDVIKSPGKWFQIEGIEFFNQRARQAFEDLI